MAGIRLKSPPSSAPCGSRHPAAEPLRAQGANIRSATDPETREGRRTRANPTGLNLFFPLRYSKIDGRRTRCSYLPCFHPLESQKGPIFGESVCVLAPCYCGFSCPGSNTQSGQEQSEGGEKAPGVSGNTDEAVCY